jgi:hypothetical protein
MDNANKLTRYRALIKRLLGSLAEPSHRRPDPDVDMVCAFDEERDQYLLMSVGWQGNRRQRGTHVYIRLKGGKVWIEDDWTDARVAERLVEAGVPEEDIVLGFHAPSMRRLTEFAVA